MSHSSLLENGHGEEKSNDVNFCELFPRELFGTSIRSIYICTGFMGVHFRSVPSDSRMKYSPQRRLTLFNVGGCSIS